MATTAVLEEQRDTASPVSEREEATLRTVVREHADHCFLDTDGVTRAAPRMLQIMDTWRPHRTDNEAGVRRNSAFDPDLRVVVVGGTKIYYPEDVPHPGQPALLFTIVPPTGV